MKNREYIAALSPMLKEAKEWHERAQRLSDIRNSTDIKMSAHSIKLAGKTAPLWALCYHLEAAIKAAIRLENVPASELAHGGPRSEVKNAI